MINRVMVCWQIISSLTGSCPRSLDSLVPIRLKDGRIYGEGRVEIFSAKLDDWGGVCGDGWSLQSANVACRQALNLSGAAEGVHNIIVNETTKI